MDAGWLGNEDATAFIAAVGGTILAVGIGMRILLRRSRAAAARRHAIDRAWSPLVGALVERGVTEPELLVCVLANYDLDLGPGGPARPSLPSAVATVAEALGRPVGEVQAALLRRGDGAERLLEDLRGLRSRLEGLPGVVRVGEPWPADATLLQQALRRYARMSGA